MAALNGQLKDLKGSLLMNQVKERLESIFTEREHDGITYIISIHFEELIGVLNSDTRFYVDIVSEDKDGHQERISKYKDSSNLLDQQVEAYINQFVEDICGPQQELFSELAYQMRGC